MNDYLNYGGGEVWYTTSYVPIWEVNFLTGANEGKVELMAIHENGRFLHRSSGFFTNGKSLI